MTANPAPSLSLSPTCTDALKCYDAFIQMLVQRLPLNVAQKIQNCLSLLNLILRAIAPEEAGRYRQLDVKAAGTEYIYPPNYLLSDLMTEFITWLNSAPAMAQHPVTFAAEAHLRFVSIHPFRDGNGRTGRLLMNLLLPHILHLEK